MTQLANEQLAATVEELRDEREHSENLQNRYNQIISILFDIGSRLGITSINKDTLLCSHQTAINYGVQCMPVLDRWSDLNNQLTKKTQDIIRLQQEASKSKKDFESHITSLKNSLRNLETELTIKSKIDCLPLVDKDERFLIKLIDTDQYLGIRPKSMLKAFEDLSIYDFIKVDQLPQAYIFDLPSAKEVFQILQESTKFCDRHQIEIAEISLKSVE